MRQQSKLKVQLTKEEFTTSDPTMIYQPTIEAEEGSERRKMSESCEISS